MTNDDPKTLVLGLGNLVHSDDGLGVHAIQMLMQDPRVPPDVVLMDGGTQGLALLPHISAFQRLLVIDALDVGEPAGTLVKVEGEALRNLPGKASVHQLGFADLMVALELLGRLAGGNRSARCAASIDRMEHGLDDAGACGTRPASRFGD